VTAHRGRAATVSDGIAGSQVVGIDLHLHRSVIGRIDELGNELGRVGIDNDPKVNRVHRGGHLSKERDALRTVRPRLLWVAGYRRERIVESLRACREALAASPESVLLQRSAAMLGELAHGTSVADAHMYIVGEPGGATTGRREF
jgi:hypothetical protein